MATKITGFIVTEARQRYSIICEQAQNGIKAIKRMANDPQADADDKMTADREIKALRSLIEEA